MPGLQGWHAALVEPVKGLYLPAEQDRQEADALPARPSEKEPMGQGVHAPCPAWST